MEVYPSEVTKITKQLITLTLEQSGADYCTFYNKTGTQCLKKIFTSLPSTFKITPRKKGFSINTLLSKKPSILLDSHVYPIHPEFENIHAKSFTIIPLALNKKPEGIICLQSQKPNFFTKEKVLELKEDFQTLLISIILLNKYEETLEKVKQRDLFTSILQHEIKNPLTSIQVYSHLIRKYLSENNLQNSHLSSALAHEATRLSQIASDLLGTSLHKGIKLFDHSYENSDLKEIIKQAKINIQHCYPQHTFIFDDHILEKAVIKGNFNRCMQVIINILSNAAKFSPIKNPIRIKLSEKGNMYRIDIIDKGKGIAKKDISHIFELYFKGDNSPSESMGIGLYLAKNIVMSHKGHINVSSKRNKGTTFSIYLPK